MANPCQTASGQGDYTWNCPRQKSVWSSNNESLQNTTIISPIRFGDSVTLAHGPPVVVTAGVRQTTVTGTKHPVRAITEGRVERLRVDEVASFVVVQVVAFVPVDAYTVAGHSARFLAVLELSVATLSHAA